MCDVWRVACGVCCAMCDVHCVSCDVLDVAPLGMARQGKECALRPCCDVM